jgi:hypothetical protein
MVPFGSVAGSRAAEVGTQPGHQLDGPKRLEDEVVGAAVQRGNGVGLVGPGRHHDQDQLRIPLAQGVAQVQPLGVRQSEIQQDQVGRAFGEQLLGLRRGFRPPHLVARSGQHPDQPGAQTDVVLHHQDPGRRHGRQRTARRRLHRRCAKGTAHQVTMMSPAMPATRQ